MAEERKKYKVNDIFYSLQGEGANTGRTAIFVRFSGCNLRCPFCDTDFDSYFSCDADYIVTEILAHCIDHGVLKDKPMVVLTGGEPTLQADEDLVEELHEEGFYVAMESNGTRPAPANIDWLTVSPKRHRKTTGKSEWRQPDELKIVFDERTDPEAILKTYFGGTTTGSPAKPLLFLQPCDTGDAFRNAMIISRCVEYILRYPKWRLSLQIHKMIGIE